MAVFFDVLLLDDEILVYKSYRTRTDRLESLITTTPGEVSPPLSKDLASLMWERQFSLESFTFVSIPLNPPRQHYKKSLRTLDNGERKDSS